VTLFLVAHLVRQFLLLQLRQLPPRNQRFPRFLKCPTFRRARLSLQYRRVQLSFLHRKAP
jgi:hypothetical protein